MTETTLRFSVDILRRLGEELNPSMAQSILELVKNAYDADARSCVIELHDVTSRGGSIKITDDGIGMDEDGIVNGWLLLGRSKKAQGGVTSLARRPVGNKGLGRLAALRMGEIAELHTIAEDKRDTRLSLEIDWNRYTSVEAVEDVPLFVEASTVESDAKAGTVIHLKRTLTGVTKAEIKRLARDLLLLADPFTNQSGFTPVLVAPEFTELAALVSKGYFDQAEFHLRADLDAEGRAVARVTDYRGNILFMAGHDDLRKDGTPYQSPPAVFELWVFILDPQAFSSRTSTLTNVKKWLQEFGGVHLYEKDIRVLPYGTPGHDWLSLNLRRSQNPEHRPSTNTSIGRVAIQGNDESLLQKTDRGGFIENHAFEELRQFAADALDWMALRRVQQRDEKKREQKTQAIEQVTRSASAVASAVQALPPQHRGAIQKAFEEVSRSHERETRALRDDIQLYRTLCTAGIAAGVFAHESNKGLVGIGRKAQTLEKEVRARLGNRFSGDVADAFASLLGASSSVRAYGNVTLGLLEHDKRRNLKVGVNHSIQTVLKLFKGHLERRKVTVETSLVSGDAFLFTSEAALESIIVNFLTNSLEALRKAAGKERQIRIETAIDDSRIRLRFMDNGGGVTGLPIRDIWLPGQSTTPGGAGLGLTIVRDTVLDLGGKVDVVQKGELGGAEFVVELPKLRGGK